MAYTLYRHYDSSGKLLYIGITGHIGRRLSQHSSSASWFSQLASSTYKHFPDIDSVLDAEREAIRSEHPAYNAQRNDLIRSGREAQGLPTARTRYGQQQRQVLVSYLKYTELHRRTEVTSGAFAAFAWEDGAKTFTGTSKRQFIVMLRKVLGSTIPLISGATGWGGDTHDKNIELARKLS